MPAPGSFFSVVGAESKRDDSSADHWKLLRRPPAQTNETTRLRPAADAGSDAPVGASADGANAPAAHGAARRGGSEKQSVYSECNHMPLLDNPVTVVESHPDVAANRRHNNNEARPREDSDFVVTDFEMAGEAASLGVSSHARVVRITLTSPAPQSAVCHARFPNLHVTWMPRPGTLSKRSADDFEPAEGASRFRFLRRMSAEVKGAIAGEWRDRFFVLRDGRLQATLLHISVGPGWLLSVNV